MNRPVIQIDLIPYKVEDLEYLHLRIKTTTSDMPTLLAEIGNLDILFVAANIPAKPKIAIEENPSLPLWLYVWLTKKLIEAMQSQGKIIEAIGVYDPQMGGVVMPGQSQTFFEGLPPL